VVLLAGATGIAVGVLAGLLAVGQMFLPSLIEGPGIAMSLWIAGPSFVGGAAAWALGLALR
jgi:hypothetical protein